MTAKRKCSRTVGDRELRGMSYPCQRPATVKHDGKYYCWQHDPGRVEADKKKRRAAEDTKWDRRSAMYARRACNAKLAALVNEETAALLDRLADYARRAAKAAKGSPDDVDEAYNDEEIARALAARIREALENTGNETL